MNKKTLDVVIADPTSHAKTQELMGWKSAEIGDWCEWEWPLNASLSLRGGTAAMHKVLLDRWPTRESMFPFAREQAAKFKIALLYSVEHIAELANQKGWAVVIGPIDIRKISFPDAKTVDASGCTALTTLDAKSAKTVYASGCTALTNGKK